MARAKRQAKKAEKIHVGFRTDPDVIEMLDSLCFANQRSRREIVELLIKHAAEELHRNPFTRINP